MKKKIAAVLGVVAVVAVMVFLPPPEWAGAQSTQAQPHNYGIAHCMWYLAHGQPRNFAACVENLAKRGEL